MRKVWLLALVGCFTRTELELALDRDGDGFLPLVAGGPDCDELRADVNPDAQEVCGDGIDNDCDGFIDDRGVGNAVFYADVDDDGFGTDVTTEACSRPPGFAVVDGDCDDADASRNPAVEDLCDGIDQNCDGVPDDAATFRSRYLDHDGRRRGCRGARAGLRGAQRVRRRGGRLQRPRSRRAAGVARWVRRRRHRL